MKRVLLLLFTGMFCVFTSSAQNSTSDVLKLSLEDCLELVYKNNHNRQSVILNELSTQEAYKQSKLERLPNLNASIGETFSNTENAGSSWNGNYSLNTGITLYQGNYLKNATEQSRLSYEQSRLSTTKFDNDLTIQVLESFLTALGNEELLHYQDAVLKSSEEQLKQGKVRYSTGDILNSDYLLLEAQYENDLNSVLETKINRDNSLNNLKNLMSLELSQEIEIVYPDDSVLNAIGVMPSEFDVVSRSIETLPNLRISDYNVEIAKAGVQISRSSYFPTLSMNAGIGTGHSNDFARYGTQIGDKLNEQIGLTLSIPIFNNSRTKSKVTQSKISLQQAQLERKQAELDIQLTLAQEYKDVVLAESKFRSSHISQNAYEASFRSYQLKFEQGSITTVELLQQQNNYISVLNDYIQSKYTFLLKRKVLDVYMGYPVKL